MQRPTSTNISIKLAEFPYVQAVNPTAGGKVSTEHAERVWSSAEAFAVANQDV
jgi:hypothetical protein